MDRHRVDADISMTDADSDLESDWHQNDADPGANPAPSFTLIRQSELFLRIMFYLSFYCQMYHNFQHFGQQIEISRKKMYFFNCFN